MATAVAADTCAETAAQIVVQKREMDEEAEAVALEKLGPEKVELGFGNPSELLKSSLEVENTKEGSDRAEGEKLFGSPLLAAAANDATEVEERAVKMEEETSHILSPKGDIRVDQDMEVVSKIDDGCRKLEETSVHIDAVTTCVADLTAELNVGSEDDNTKNILTGFQRQMQDDKDVDSLLMDKTVKKDDNLSTTAEVDPESQIPPSCKNKDEDDDIVKQETISQCSDKISSQIQHQMEYNEVETENVVASEIKDNAALISAPLIQVCETVSERDTTVDAGLSTACKEKVDDDSITQHEQNDEQTSTKASRDGNENVAVFEVIREVEQQATDEMSQDDAKSSFSENEPQKKDLNAAPEEIESPGLQQKIEPTTFSKELIPVESEETELRGESEDKTADSDNTNDKILLHKEKELYEEMATIVDTAEITNKIKTDNDEKTLPEEVEIGLDKLAPEENKKVEINNPQEGSDGTAEGEKMTELASTDKAITEENNSSAEDIGKPSESQEEAEDPSKVLDKDDDGGMTPEETLVQGDAVVNYAGDLTEKLNEDDESGEVCNENDSTQNILITETRCPKDDSSTTNIQGMEAKEQDKFFIPEGMTTDILVAEDKEYEKVEEENCLAETHETAPMGIQSLSSNSNGSPLNTSATEATGLIKAGSSEVGPEPPEEKVGDSIREHEENLTKEFEEQGSTEAPKELHMDGNETVAVCAVISEVKLQDTAKMFKDDADSKNSICENEAEKNLNAVQEEIEGSGIQQNTEPTTFSKELISNKSDEGVLKGESEEKTYHSENTNDGTTLQEKKTDNDEKTLPEEVEIGLDKLATEENKKVEINNPQEGCDGTAEGEKMTELASTDKAITEENNSSAEDIEKPSKTENEMQEKLFSEGEHREGQDIGIILNRGIPPYESQEEAEEPSKELDKDDDGGMTPEETSVQGDLSEKLNEDDESGEVCNENDSTQNVTNTETSCPKDDSSTTNIQGTEAKEQDKFLIPEGMTTDILVEPCDDKEYEKVEEENCLADTSETAPMGIQSLCSNSNNAQAVTGSPLSTSATEGTGLVKAGSSEVDPAPPKEKVSHSIIEHEENLTKEFEEQGSTEAPRELHMDGNGTVAVCAVISEVKLQDTAKMFKDDADSKNSICENEAEKNLNAALEEIEPTTFSKELILNKSDEGVLKGESEEKTSHSENTNDGTTLQEKQLHEEMATLTDIVEGMSENKRENDEMLPVEPEVVLDKLAPEETNMVEIDNPRESMKNNEGGNDRTVEVEKAIEKAIEEPNSSAEPIEKPINTEDEMLPAEPEVVLDKLAPEETNMVETDNPHESLKNIEDGNDGTVEVEKAIELPSVAKVIEEPNSSAEPIEKPINTEDEMLPAEPEVVLDKLAPEETNTVEIDNPHESLKNNEDGNDETVEVEKAIELPSVAKAIEEPNSSAEPIEKPINTEDEMLPVEPEVVLDKLAPEETNTVEIDNPRESLKNNEDGNDETVEVEKAIELPSVAKAIEEPNSSAEPIEKPINTEDEMLPVEPEVVLDKLAPEETNTVEIDNPRESLKNNEDGNDGTVEVEKAIELSSVAKAIEEPNSSAEPTEKPINTEDEMLPVEPEVVLDKLAPEETNMVEIDNPRESLKNNEDGNDGTVEVEKAFELPSVAKAIEEPNSSAEPIEKPINTEDEMPERLSSEGENREDQDVGVILTRGISPSESKQEAEEPSKVLNKDEDKGMTQEPLVQADAIMNCAADLTGSPFSTSATEETSSVKAGSSEVDPESAKASSDTIEDEIVKEETFSQDNKRDQICTQIEHEGTLDEVETEDVQGVNYLLGSQLVASEIKETNLDEAVPVTPKPFADSAQVSETVLQVDINTNDNDDNHQSKILEKDTMVDGSLPQENPKEKLSDMITEHVKQASVEAPRGLHTDDNETVAVCEGISEVKQQCTAEMSKDEADSKNFTCENEAEISLNVVHEEIERSGLQQYTELTFSRELILDKIDDVIFKGESEDKFSHSENINDGIALHEKQLHEEMATIADIAEGTSGTKRENDDKTLPVEPEVVLNKLVPEEKTVEIDNPHEFLKCDEEGSDETVEGENMIELPSVSKAIVEEHNGSQEPIGKPSKTGDEMPEKLLSEGENRDGQDMGIILNRGIPLNETQQEAEEPSNVLDKDDDKGMTPEEISVQADAVINSAADLTENLKDSEESGEACKEQDKLFIPEGKNMDSMVVESSDDKEYGRVEKEECFAETSKIAPIGIQSLCSDSKNFQAGTGSPLSTSVTEETGSVKAGSSEVDPESVKASFDKIEGEIVKEEAFSQDNKRDQICTQIEHEITHNDMETENVHGVDDLLGSELVASEITETTLDEAAPITPEPADSAPPREVFTADLQGEINTNDNDNTNQSKILEQDIIVDGNLSTACKAQENPKEKLSDLITEHEGNLPKESEDPVSTEASGGLHTDDHETTAVCEVISQMKQHGTAEMSEDDADSKNSICQNGAEKNLNAAQEEIERSCLQQNTEPTTFSKELISEQSNEGILEGESEDKASHSQNTDEGITLQEKKRENDEKTLPDEHEVMLDKLAPDESKKVEIGNPHEISKSNEEGSDGTVEGEKMIELPSVAKDIIEENNRSTEPIENPSKTEDELPEKLFSEGENREGQDTGIILNREIPPNESQPEAEEPPKVLEKDDDEGMTPEKTFVHADAVINCPADFTENLKEDGEKSGEVCNENDSTQSILATKTSFPNDDSNETNVQGIEDKEQDKDFITEGENMENMDSLVVESHDDKEDGKVKKEESLAETCKIPLMKIQSQSSDNKDAHTVIGSPLSTSPTEETGSEKAGSSEVELESIKASSDTMEDEIVKQEIFSHGSSSCQISSQMEQNIEHDEVETETIQGVNDLLGSQLVSPEIKETGLGEGTPVSEKTADPAPLIEVHGTVLEGGVHLNENKEDHQCKIIEKDNIVDDSVTEQEENITRAGEEQASEEESRGLHIDENETVSAHDVISEVEQQDTVELSKDDVDSKDSLFKYESEKENLHAPCEETEKEALPQNADQTAFNEELISVKDDEVLRGESEDKAAHSDNNGETNPQETNMLTVDLDEAKSIQHNENSACATYSMVDEKPEEQIYTATDMPTQELKQAYEANIMPEIKVLGDTSVQGQSDLDLISACPVDIHVAEDTGENSNAMCLEEVADMENQEDQIKQDGSQRATSEVRGNLSKGIENEISKDCICSNTIINKEESLNSSTSTGEARGNEEDAKESKEEIKEPVTESIYHNFQTTHADTEEQVASSLEEENPITKIVNETTIAETSSPLGTREGTVTKEILLEEEHSGINSEGRSLNVLEEEKLELNKKSLEHRTEDFMINSSDSTTKVHLESVQPDEELIPSSQSVAEEGDESIISDGALTSSAEDTCPQKVTNTSSKPESIVLEKTQVGSRNEEIKEECTTAEDSKMEPQECTSGEKTFYTQSVENEKIIEVGTAETLKDEDSKMYQDKLVPENSNVEPKNLDASYSTDKEIQGAGMEEAYIETSELDSEKSDHVIESASEVHKLEMPLEAEKVDLVEENLAETEIEEIVIKKTNEENDIIKADISSEQIQIADQSVIVKSSLDCPEEVLSLGAYQEDELKPEENELEKLGENESIKTTCGVRPAEPHEISCIDHPVAESLQQEENNTDDDMKMLEINLSEQTKELSCEYRKKDDTSPDEEEEASSDDKAGAESSVAQDSKANILHAIETAVAEESHDGNGKEISEMPMLQEQVKHSIADEKQNEELQSIVDGADTGKTLEDEKLDSFTEVQEEGITGEADKSQKTESSTPSVGECVQLMQQEPVLTAVQPEIQELETEKVSGAPLETEMNQTKTIEMSTNTSEETSHEHGHDEIQSDVIANSQVLAHVKDSDITEEECPLDLKVTNIEQDECSASESCKAVPTEAILNISTEGSASRTEKNQCTKPELQEENAIKSLMQGPGETTMEMARDGETDVQQKNPDFSFNIKDSAMENSSTETEQKDVQDNIDIIESAQEHVPGHPYELQNDEADPTKIQNDNSTVSEEKGFKNVATEAASNEAAGLECGEDAKTEVEVNKETDRSQTMESSILSGSNLMLGSTEESSQVTEQEDTKSQTEKLCDFTHNKDSEMTQPREFPFDFTEIKNNIDDKQAQHESMVAVLDTEFPAEADPHENTEVRTSSEDNDSQQMQQNSESTTTHNDLEEMKPENAGEAKDNFEGLVCQEEKRTVDHCREKMDTSLTQSTILQGSIEQILKPKLSEDNEAENVEQIKSMQEEDETKNMETVDLKDIVQSMQEKETVVLSAPRKDGEVPNVSTDEDISTDNINASQLPQDKCAETFQLEAEQMKEDAKAASTHIKIEALEQERTTKAEAALEGSAYIEENRISDGCRKMMETAEMDQTVNVISEGPVQVTQNKHEEETFPLPASEGKVVLETHEDSTVKTNQALDEPIAIEDFVHISQNKHEEETNPHLAPGKLETEPNENADGNTSNANENVQQATSQNTSSSEIQKAGDEIVVSDDSAQLNRDMHEEEACHLPASVEENNSNGNTNVIQHAEEETKEATERRIPTEARDETSIAGLPHASLKRREVIFDKEEEHEEARSDQEEEEGGEHKGEDSGPEAPVIVENAAGDADVKAGKKKHHNILSGVGSKVKHSIAKVKKVITGKSSPTKQHSPK